MNSKKSIAFLCHPYHRGGVTRWMADAAIALSATGHEVFFITVEPVKEFFSAKGRETMLQLLNKVQNAVRIIKCRAGYEFEFGTDEYRAYVYQRLIAQLPAGTPIILSDSAPTWAAATAFYGTHPIVGVLHADEAHYYDLAAKYYKQVDILACVSERVSKTAKANEPGLNPEQVYVIPCGIELMPVQPRPNKTEDAIHLVYVGRISEYQKRTGDLVKIAAELAKEGTKFHLDIIGDGAEARRNLEHGFNGEGLSADVTFWGWLSQQEVANHLLQSDILVLTSDFEGTPIAMMEALAAGCGMVGTRVSGIEDYEHHPLAANCYKVYEVGDIAGAVANIHKLAAMPQNKRAAAARQMAETMFTMDVCLHKYLEAITQIPERKGTRSKVSLRVIDILYSRAIAFARYSKLKLQR